MGARRIMTVAAALITAASFTGVVAATASAATPMRPASFVVQETGYGATLTAAETAARQEIISDYLCSAPYTVIADGQEANGTWYATETATCTAYR